jgi:hypothetical protein
MIEPGMEGNNMVTREKHITVYVGRNNFGVKQTKKFLIVDTKTKIRMCYYSNIAFSTRQTLLRMAKAAQFGVHKHKRLTFRIILAGSHEIPNDGSCWQCHTEAASNDCSVDGQPNIASAPYATAFSKSKIYKTNLKVIIHS